MYEQCVLTVGEDASAKELLRCVVLAIEAEKDAQTEFDENAYAFSNAYLLIHSAALVFLMQAGFAMLAAGSVRTKNVGESNK